MENVIIILILSTIAFAGLSIYLLFIVIKRLRRVHSRDYEYLTEMGQNDNLRAANNRLVKKLRKVKEELRKVKGELRNQES